MKIVNNSYIEEDLPVINDYNAAIEAKWSCRQSADDYKIHLDALFEFGLTGKIDTALFVLCGANSGYEPEDVNAFKDCQLQEEAGRIRTDKSVNAITLSPAARKYPMFQWLQKYFNSSKKESLFTILKTLLNTQDDDKVWNWLAAHYAMRDLFYYHTHKLDMSSWKKSCRKITGNDYVAHQKYSYDDVRRAIQLNKPVIVGMGIGTWRKYIPEIKECSASQNIFRTICYSWVTNGNLILAADYKKYKNSDRPEREMLLKKSWDRFTQALETEMNRL